ncbi:hypothetical protein ACVGOW_19675 [Pseudonocardia saturnea]
MPTHRPHHPTPRRAALTAPLIVVSRLAALSATAMLVNFGWTSAYRPDPFHERHPRHRPEPDDQHTAAPADSGTAGPVGSARSDVLPSETGHPAPRPPAVGNATGGAAEGGDETADSEEAGGAGAGELAGPGAVAHAADRVDEETTTAHWFVTAALDGGLGDAHQQAARTAVSVATEHGFVDDPTRVAEALVVFLHPDHR